MPSRSQRKVWRSLGRRKGRDEHGLLLAEGPRLLSELLTSGWPVEHVIYTPSSAARPELAVRLTEAADGGAELHEIPPEDLASLADSSHPQGVLAVAPIPRWDWQDIGAPRILVLDGIQDPGNTGALLRNAEALGLAGAMTLERTADPWGPKTVRAAAGSSFRLPVVRASRSEALARLSAEGIELWVADAAGEPIGRGTIAPDRLALAMGGEAAGVSPELRAAAGRSVAVPMAPPVESLNVAAAGAILMDRLFGSTDGT